MYIERERDLGAARHALAGAGSAPRPGRARDAGAEPGDKK